MRKFMGWTKRRGRERGFTMVELMVSVAILTVVVGVVVDGLTKLMQRNTMETVKVDLTQESREFMDQIVNDIHQSGYPSLKMFDPATLTSATNCTLDINVACGLVNVTASSVQFEGDIDGTGTVSEVSAIEVASTTRRCSAGRSARSCSAAGSSPCSGRTMAPHPSSAVWARRISAMPGRNARMSPVWPGLSLEANRPIALLWCRRRA